jgi:proline racemase
VIKTIDAHVGGQALRLVVGGFPAPRGTTMSAKRDWTSRHADHLRRVLMLEPRGHRDLKGAVLTEPVAPGSHAGVVFMGADGCMSMSGHGIIAAVTIALERGLIEPGGDGRHVTFDTPAGTIRSEAQRSDGGVRRVEHVAFLNVPSFVLRPGLDVPLAERRVRVDLAFGGLFYAIVDSESAGVTLQPSGIPELRRAGIDIARAVSGSGAVHPVDASVSGVHGTVFISPPHQGGADLRLVAVLADGSVSRCASGTGLSAVMAVLSAMGLLEDGRFVAESIVGTTLTGAVAGRTVVGDHDAIVPRIEGRAWITGDHVFHADDGDPIAGGLDGL